MRKYLARRLFQIVLTMFIYLTIVFIIIQAQPGDITDMYIMNPKIPPEAREAIRHQLGLDRPLIVQYFNYLRNVVTGNLGKSFIYYPTPVWTIIKQRLPRTVVLFLTALLIYYSIGFQLGKIIAWRRGGVTEYSATIVGVFLWTVFTPWWALLMIYIFAFKLHWFPIGKFITVEIWRHFDVSPNRVFNTMLLVAASATLFTFLLYMLVRRFGRRRTAKIAGLGGLLFSIGVILYLLFNTTIGYLARDIIHHMILPIFTLVTIGFGGSMLVMRDSMLETIREDYIMAAKAKGLPDKVVRDKHAARNALLPIVTSFILAIATVVDGGIITETIFSWPGMGLTLLNAVLQEDMPLAVGTFIFTGVFLLFAHLVADILYAYLDPRIKYG